MMRKGKGVILVAVLCVVFMAVSVAQNARMTAEEKRAKALELLDKFTETADKIHTSFITKSKLKVYSDNKYSGKWAYLTGKRTQYVLEEFRTDGERAKQIRQQWGDYKSNGEILYRPESEKSYYSDTYDGEKRYQYNRSYDSIGKVFLYSRGPGKDYTVDRHLSYKDSASACFGYLQGDIERFDHILKKAGAGQISIRDKMEDLNGTVHYVINAKTNKGQYTIWLNPEKGYNFSKAVVLREAGDLYRGGEYTLDTGDKKKSFIVNTQFIDVNGVWVPVKAKAKIHNTSPGGNVKIIKDIELTSILIDPDHDALGSFLIDDIKDGARVLFVDNTPGKYIKYIWRDGDVVDANGKVIMSCYKRPKKAKKERR